MRTIITTLTAVCLTALLWGCGGNSIEGTYHNVENAAETIELKNDGTFVLTAGEMGISGKYAVDGKTLILNPKTHMEARGKVEGDLIIDNDGTRWQKRKS
jgi:hypothetical protein